jgi:hypothetical protein
MAGSREPDRTILRQGLYILLNLPAKEREIAAPALKGILAALGVEAAASGAAA